MQVIFIDLFNLAPDTSVSQKLEFHGGVGAQSSSVPPVGNIEIKNKKD